MKRFLVIIFCILSLSLLAQQPDSLDVKNDSLVIHADSIVHKDTNKVKPIDRIIEYEATDSIHFFLDSSVSYLYRKVDLKSDKMELKAGKVRIDFKKDEVEAFITHDSIGRIQEKPEFTTDEDNFVASYMKYNFKTRKGYARNVKTEQPEGYLHGDQIKIFPDKTTNILHGKFTTCNLDHPHYYISLSRAKYIPNKSIITGPFHFVIEDIPFPIGLPFGYFPQRRYNSSGIVQPQFFQEQARGLGLVDGGYYFVINDYSDLRVTADVYSRGDWGVHTRLRVKRRYKYSAVFAFNYTHRTSGERILLDSRRENLYNIQVNYNQAQKANPTSHFSAHIDFSKGNYDQYNATNIMAFVKNTSKSSIAYQKKFRGTPFSFSVNSSVVENFRDSTIYVNAPNINLNMNRVQPFKNLWRFGGKERWYNRIGFTMRSYFKNDFKVRDTLLFYHPDTLKYFMKNGIRYDIPLNTSFNLFKFFRLSPSFNYTGRVYFSYIHKYLDADSNVVVDTIYRPRHIVDYRFNLNLSTKLYGMFKINAFGIKAIRHVLTPSIGFAYKPDFADPKWGYYERDPLNPDALYTVFYQRTVGIPSIGLQKAMTFSLNNNFEMKVRQKKDTTYVDKKVKLIDRLLISGSYNFAADSLNWSFIRLSASARPNRNSNVSIGATFDPYTVDKNGKRINTYEYMVSGHLLRLVNLNMNFNLSLSSKDLKKEEQTKEKKKDQEYIPYHYFDPEWTFSMNYRFNLTKAYNQLTQSYSKVKITQLLNFNFAIKPTPYWSVSVISGYDFNRRQMVSTTLNVYRDLHCWEMFLAITPYGRMRSYLFTVRIKSPMFKFFEFKRQRSWHDNFIY